MFHRLFVIAVLLMAPTGVAQSPSCPIGIELSSQVPMTPAVKAALQDLGIQYVNFYVKARRNETDDNALAVCRAMIAACEELHLPFSLACHNVDVPPACLAEAAKHDGFRGIVFDDLAHCRLLNAYGPSPLLNPNTLQTFPQAYDATLAALKDMRDRYAAQGVDVVATHMWPVLLHDTARAGFVVCPKICKELYSPVSLAIAIGAAKQYDRPLWVDCDLWFWDLIPGHPPEEFRSNLLLAYWLGADLIYVEGCGYNLEPAGEQGTPFSLVNQITPDAYQLTAHGEVLRRFCREYVPQHPRAWSFRDVKPDIAIVRFPDSCHGQRYTGDWPDRLYGSPHLHSDADTEAWLGLWNLLTFGHTGRDGLSLFKAWVGPSGYERGVDKKLAASYLTRPAQADLHRFFVPLNGVVVYDHTVGYELLENVPLIFLTGKFVSDETMKAIERRVQEGAVAVLWGPLARQHGFDDWNGGVLVREHGAGRFVITDDFGFREVYNEIKTMIGQPDKIRYRFGNERVTLWHVTDNEVRVAITPEG